MFGVYPTPHMWYRGRIGVTKGSDVPRKSSEQQVSFATKRGTTGYVLDGVDGRTGAARRFRELYTGFETQLGDDLTEIQKALLARACTLCIWCEEQEAAMARGEAFSAETYATLTNTLRRLLADLGLSAPEPEPERFTIRPLFGGPEITLPSKLERPERN